MDAVESEIRYFDALCYEDVRLLVVRSPESGARDVLAMEITLAHHKGHNRRPKPLVQQAPQHVFQHYTDRRSQHDILLY